jgi:hypothetical protein
LLFLLLLLFIVCVIIWKNWVWAYIWASIICCIPGARCCCFPCCCFHDAEASMG